MTAPRFLTHKEAEAAGWFSRRHETDAAHTQAQRQWRENRSRQARRRRADERLAAVEPVAEEAGKQTIGEGR